MYVRNIVYNAFLKNIIMLFDICSFKMYLCCCYFSFSSLIYICRGRFVNIVGIMFYNKNKLIIIILILYTRTQEHRVYHRRNISFHFIYLFFTRTGDVASFFSAPLSARYIVNIVRTRRVFYNFSLLLTRI